MYSGSKGGFHLNIVQRKRNTVYLEQALLCGVRSSHLPVRERLPERGSQSGTQTGQQREDDEETHQLEELAQLTRSAGAIVVDKVIQTIHRPTPNYYLGQGKVAEMADLIAEKDIDVVIFNNDLSPAQIRNLEQTLDTKVLDRTELILDIFATHARTQTAKLQVELAQLEYALPRLKGRWTHLAQIEGGIGQRGPGEKQIELDRRLAHKRIIKLKAQIERIKERRAREVASRQDNFNIALVGYTNAGKSTLMNRLTGAHQPVEDKLFSTLDTKINLWALSSHFGNNPQGKGGKVLLSDTVGFIRNLPHHLVASFYATLEEARQADLLLLVIDASSPEVLLQVETVKATLSELEINPAKAGLIFNKMDRADPMELTIMKKQFPEALFISALDGTGLDRLEEKVSGLLKESQEELHLKIPVREGKLLAFLSAHGQVLKKVYQDSVVNMVVRLSPRDAYQVKQILKSR